MSEESAVAVVYCDGHFQDPNGKTAHGLVRFTRRYDVLCVIDRATAGRDAGEVLDGKRRNIPLVADLGEALSLGAKTGRRPTHLVIGVAPDGGRMDDGMKSAVRQALEAGLNVDSGLHDFLTEMPEMVALAAKVGKVLRDVRKPPPRSELHGFTGKIAEVKSRTIALLGTDSAVGKRTTAWMLVDALRAAGKTAEMIGTGQTGWMQGAKYGIVLDSLVNDFVAGELEHACWRAWTESKPDFLVVEGQGSLMNPAYPGGLEILAATRPECVVLQHAPARKEYDGFPGFPMHPLDHQIHALELVSGRPVIAVTVNQESLSPDEVDAACAAIEQATGLPTCAPIRHGVKKVVEALGVR